MLNFLGYIDPGSGLMLVQIVAAAVCGFTLSIKKVREWIVRPFIRANHVATKPADKAP